MRCLRLARAPPHPEAEIVMPTSGAMPRCFIGSSREGEPSAKALAHHLREAGVPVEMWSLSTFAVGNSTMEDLEHAMSRCSFAAFIATADDETTSRGARKLSPRDNIVFEFGLFAGRLGRDRTFLLVPDDLRDLKLPSDLLGITVGRFAHGETVAERREGMASVAEELIERIEQQGPIEAPSDPALANALLSSVSGQLTGLAAIGRLELEDRRRREWVQMVLVAALEPFLSRTPDAYALWLRPNDDERLDVEAAVNFAPGYEHYQWARGEGLAGRVWDTGRSAAISKMQKHPWYQEREGCENESYVCAAVGGPGGSGGILAIGSDQGFPVNQGDEGLVRAYAAILALVQ
jgi:predicted nucleotide-binding protein